MYLVSIFGSRKWRLTTHYETLKIGNNAPKLGPPVVGPPYCRSKIVFDVSQLHVNYIFHRSQSQLSPANFTHVDLYVCECSSLRHHCMILFFEVDVGAPLRMQDVGFVEDTIATQNVLAKEACYVINVI